MNWNVDLYNEKHGFVHQYGSHLIDLLDPKSGELILDLGCGSGQLTAKISESGATVIGIDGSKDMIQASKNLFPDMDFYHMNADSFFFDQPFDAIFSNAVLHWIQDQIPATKNMYTHLKPGGRLVVEFGGYGNVANIVNALRKSLNNHGFHKNAGFERWYFPTIGEYTSVLESTGFEVSLAQLYDRPTFLDSKNEGIKDWIEMFGNHFFEGINAKEKAAIVTEVQNNLKLACFKDGKWYADYRRIRVVAFKKQD